MSIESILKQEELLFSQWKIVQPLLCQDGIVCLDSYQRSKQKILLLLKEPNALGESIDLRAFLLNGAYNRKPTWENALRWIYGIQNIEYTYEWNAIKFLFDSEETRKQYLKSILFCNLQKLGAGHTTHNADFYDNSIKGKDYTVKQLKLYFETEDLCPDITIIGGSIATRVFSTLFGIRDNEWKMTSKGIWYYEMRKGKYVIDFVHPEVRIQPQYVYYMLVDTVRELLKAKPSISIDESAA